MKDAPGKTALITGASVGIGRDLAELFARDGHYLVLTARNESQLQELAATLRDRYHVNVEVIVQDLAAAGAAQRIFEPLQSKSIDYLVNNAGFGTHGPFAASDLQSQLAMLQVNIVALTHLTRLFVPGMLARKSGRILNVASLAAFLPGPYMAVYYATKAYVLSFSEALSSETAGSGVTVTALCPGATRTEFQKRAGIGEVRQIMGNATSSMEVARIGYDAMMRGRSSVVAGLANKLSAFAIRFMPRSRAAAIAKGRNKNR
jgi:short-subunit dehydrogenase